MGKCFCEERQQEKKKDMCEEDGVAQSESLFFFRLIKQDLKEEDGWKEGAEEEEREKPLPVA